MAKLLVKTAGLENALIDLRLGVNRVGRSSDADFQIEHVTVSNLHCELVLRESGVIVRDLESLNGTFINDRPVREAALSAGQTLRLGDVELFVENTDVTVVIPKFISAEPPAWPAVPPNRRTDCMRHPRTPITHRCTHCKEEMCEDCVHRLRRRGSKKVLALCPVCSGMVEPIPGAQPPKKKSLFARVTETVKLKFKQTVNLAERGD
jgi:pSer/pThr/pTyr-binding forkhead associated (FHA) protein